MLCYDVDVDVAGIMVALPVQVVGGIGVVGDVVTDAGDVGGVDVVCDGYGVVMPLVMAMTLVLMVACMMLCVVYVLLVAIMLRSVMVILMVMVLLWCW